MKHKIKINPNQLAYFRRKARNDAPKETLAYLVGKIVSPELVVVEEFAYTKDYATQTTEEVSWWKEDYDKLKKHAEERGYTVVGDIHSHPNYWPVLSPDDHKHIITEGHRVCGVYAFLNHNSKTCFWVADSSLPCSII